MVNWTGVARRAGGKWDAPSGSGLVLVCGLGAVMAAPVLIGQAVAWVSAPPVPPAHVWSTQVDVPRVELSDPLAAARAAADDQRAEGVAWAGQKMTLPRASSASVSQPKAPKQATPSTTTTVTQKTTTTSKGTTTQSTTTKTTMSGVAPVGGSGG